MEEKIGVEDANGDVGSKLLDLTNTHNALKEGVKESARRIARLQASMDEAKIKSAENIEKGFDRAKPQVELLYPSLDLSWLESFNIV